MGSVQGPVICRTLHVKQVGVRSLPVKDPFIKAVLLESEFWKLRRGYRCGIKVRPLVQHSSMGIYKRVTCSLGSASDGEVNGNLNDDDTEYINSSIVDAVEIKSGADGFIIKMSDGRQLTCVQNNPRGSYLPDYSPHPAIVLKMEDGSNLLLPIIVLEIPSMMLMAAVRNVQLARPSLYQVMKDMTEKMGYAVRLVRVTERVNEAYYAKLYLAKVGDERESFSIDLRPSDAINIAVRSEVPIQVNKYLAYNDGIKIAEPAKLAQPPLSDALLGTELDRPDGKPCVETKDFDLVRNMIIAADEERYRDAAQLRDLPAKLCSKWLKWT